MSRYVALLPFLLGTVAHVAPAYANEAAVAEDNASAELAQEIIVTAQKFEQRAADVPMTISAITGERMRELGVSDLDEIAHYIPGLNIQEQSANNPGIVIRGITSDSGSAQQAPRVTLYYNGIDISRSRGSYQDVFDLERVEVVKGPQATLFGTASTIGAISLVSARPKADTSAELTAGFGNYNQRQVSGYVNAGSEVLAGRVAFAWKARDGYVNNLASNQDDLNGQDQFGVRGSLRFRPVDAVTADLIVTYDRQRNPGTAFINKRLPPASTQGSVFGDAWLGGSPLSKEVLGMEKLGLNRDVYDVNFTATWDIDANWAITTVNGYRDFDSLETFDADGSRAWYLEFAEDAKGWQASHETRVSYTSDTLRASAGWNFFRERGSQIVPFSSEEGTFLQCSANVVPGLGCIAADGTVTAAQATAALTRGAATVLPYQSVYGNKGRNDSYSAFAEVTWIPMPKLEVTAGARVLGEKRESGYFANVPNAVLTGSPLIPSQIDTAGKTYWAEDKYSAFLPRFNVLYRFSDRINGFATISKGRRSPTVQLSAKRGAGGAEPSLSFIPEETVWNYEVGLKGSAGIASGSIGVYYQKYKDFQVSRTVDGRNVTESAGNAGNLGVEAEMQVKVTPWLRLFGSVGYIGGGIDDKAENGVYAGDRFRLQPRVQAAGGFTLDVPVGETARLFMTPSVTHRSKIYFEVPNKEEISQDAVTLVNVRGGISLADDALEIALYARNLTNKDYLLDAGNTGGSFGYPTYIPGEPRLYGMQVTARF